MDNKILNVVPGLHDERDFFTRVVRSARATAAAGSTRIDLRPLFPPVYDQLSLGSCTANAACAVQAYNQKQFQGIPSPVLLSRLFEYFSSRTNKASDTGATIKDAVAALASLGSCPESQWPYDIRKYAQQPPHDCYVSAASNRISQYARVPQTRSAFEAALSAGMPIVFGVAVYESFGRVNANGLVPVPNTRKERLLGGHALVIVGYDNSNPSNPLFIVRNSWGLRWGDKGYCYMPYAYILDRNLAFDPWTFLNKNVPVGTPVSSPTHTLHIVDPRHLFEDEEQE